MRENISVLIVEDELIWSRIHEQYLKSLGIHVAGIATGVAEAIDAFKNISFDVALLDIHLNGSQSGIELGKMLTSVYNKPFVFLTGSHGGHEMQEAVAARPSAYLTKPVHTSSLYIAIQNALQHFPDRSVPENNGKDDTLQSFFVKSGNRLLKIDWKDVVYLAAGKNYVSFYNVQDRLEYQVRGSLQHAMSHIIPPAMQHLFVQVNRGEVIQLPYVREICADKVVTPYKTFSLSEGYSREIRKRLRILS